jgi:hypothetical protein
MQSLLQSTTPPSTARVDPFGRVLGYVEVDLQQLSQPQPLVTFNLGNTVNLNANEIQNLSEPNVNVILSEVSTGSANMRSFTGNVVGDPDSVVSASVQDGRAHIRIDFGRQLVVIRSLPGGQPLAGQRLPHEVVLIDKTEFDPEAEPQEPSAPDFDESPSPARDETTNPKACSSSPEVRDVRLLVLYTGNAQEAAGGEAQVRTAIDSAVAESVQIYSNSGINMKLTLAAIERYDFQEGRNFSSMLARFRNDTGVKRRRNQHAADLVTLITGIGGTEGLPCGIGYVMPRLSTDWQGGVNISALRCLDNKTLVHEAGHNMGGDHHEPACGGGVFGYSCGHRVDGKFATIMAYPNRRTPRIAYFSNPEKSYRGDPTGIANARDNARTLNETRCAVSRFR